MTTRRAAVRWKEDETVTLLEYYRKKRAENYFNDPHTDGKWHAFQIHINSKYHDKHPTVYDHKTGYSCGEKIRSCKNLYKKYRKEFAASKKLMTETGRETDEFDDESCQQSWRGWELYHGAFKDDPSIETGVSQLSHIVLLDFGCKLVSLLPH